MFHSMQGQNRPCQYVRILLTTSLFFSNIVNLMPGTLAGRRMPALMPASPAPMTATLTSRTWSMQWLGSMCSFEVGYDIGSSRRVLTRSVSLAGARWPVSCATRRVEFDVCASVVRLSAAGITGAGAITKQVRILWCLLPRHDQTITKSLWARPLKTGYISFAMQGLRDDSDEPDVCAIVALSPLLAHA